MNVEELLARYAAGERDFSGIGKLTGDACLDGVDLRDSCLQDACFSHADLRNANLRRASLGRVSFDEANLQGANLKQVELASDATWYCANLSGAFIDETTVFCWDKTTLPNGQIKTTLSNT